jgi:flavin reductase (DIM6/NTAB) family NADH-FMN oxidoreductase RutF
VNILRADQQHLANRFANREESERANFDDVPLREGVSGAPIFAGCLAYADCRIVAAHEAGDHTIFVGEMLDGEVMGEAQPLTFFRRRYRDLLVEDEAEV